MIVVHRFTALRIAEAYKDDDERGLWCQDDQVLELEAERDKLEAENKRLREAFELIKGEYTVEIMRTRIPQIIQLATE